MADYNSVVLLGRLSRDPELKYAPSGAPVRASKKRSFSLAAATITLRPGISTGLMVELTFIR